MDDTKKLLEAIEKLTEELKRANDRLQMPTYVPYPVPQPYPVYPVYPQPAPYYSYNPPYFGPVTTYTTCGIGASNTNQISHNAVGMTDSYHQ